MIDTTLKQINKANSICLPNHSMKLAILAYEDNKNRKAGSHFAQ